MPARVKLKVGLLFGLLGGLAASSMTAGARLSPVIGAAIFVLWILGSLFAAFVYWPKLDFTGNTLWRGSRRQKRIALTFDDGPAQATAQILDVLKARNVQATFFFLGVNARQRPELVIRARAEGHAIGSHGDTHKKMHRLRRAQIDHELQAAEACLGEIATAHGRKILRVPHGFKSLTVVRAARRLGYVLIGWTLGVWDSDCPGAAVIARRANAGVRPGSILLLHDGAGSDPEADRRQTATALTQIIDYCRGAGYQFVTVPELFS